jgi:hypothetical protein
MRLNLYNRFLKFMGHKVPVWVILVIMNFYWLTTSVYDVIIQRGFQMAINQMEAGELTVLEGRVTPSGRLKRIEEFLGMPRNVETDKPIVKRKKK